MREMRTASVIIIATLTLVSGVSAPGEEQQNPGQEQETQHSLPPASKGWPEQWGQRKLHRGENAFIYAQKKSTADEAAKALQAVVEEARREGVIKPAVGLIVAIDAQEKFPLEIAKLTEILKDPNTRMEEERSKGILNSVEGASKLSDEAGTDVNSLVAVIPILLRPAALPKISPEFPEGLDREIAWCLLVPTDRCVTAGARAAVDAVVTVSKMSWKERLLIGAAMPLAQRAVREKVRKTWQADLYQLLVEGQKDWSKELKKEKVDAYRQKLGLGNESTPEADEERTKARQEGESGSG